MAGPPGYNTSMQSWLTPSWLIRVALTWAVLLPATGARARPGHDWDAWRTVTTWSPPHVATSQKGRSDLVPLLESGCTDDPLIEGIEAWQRKRDKQAAMIESLLGTPRPMVAPTPEWDVLDEEVLSDHVRRRVRVRSECHDWVTAYLLLPRPLPEGRLPAMICLHQRVAQGKDEPCGLEGNPDMAIALQLVRRGYVALAPDMIGFGERMGENGRPYGDSIQFYRRHPGWSYFGKMMWDTSRMVDALRSLPEVDPLRIGCVGHSLGGYTALMAAAFEPRISLAIVSGGFSTLRGDDRPERWSHLTPLWPQLGFYLPHVQQVPFDWHDICSLVAPRPLFVGYTTRDKVFSGADALNKVAEQLRGIYGLYGAADDVTFVSADLPRGFPRQARQAAWQWLDQRIAGPRLPRRIPSDLDQWRTCRSRIAKDLRRTLGQPRSRGDAPDLRWLCRERTANYVRHLIEYSVGCNDPVRGYLHVPTGADGKRPGVLALHQTTPIGKREAAGLEGDANLAFGHELAERGYVTLSPDSICAGDRIDRFGAFDTRGHYLRHPTLSAMGKMLFDAQRALDVLISLDEVDAQRVGAVGHSLGAEQAAMLAAFDNRVHATVASCGWSTFEADQNKLRWARDRWFSYMPKLRPVFLRGDLPAWDWHDVVRRIAPRAYYQHTKRDDPIFPEAVSAYEATEEARPIWRLYGEEQRLNNVLLPGPHTFSAEARQEAYEWLDQQLEHVSTGL